MAKGPEERTYAATPTRLYQAASRAVAELGYTILHSDAGAGILTFNTGRSMKSWAGQDLSATILGLSSDESRMLVGGSLGKGGNPLGGGSQIGSWGEKKALTRKFFEQVVSVLPSVAEPIEAPASPDESFAGQVAKLADLHSAGTLTDEEFAIAKRRLLG